MRTLTSSQEARRQRFRRVLIEIGVVFLAALCVTLVVRHYLLEPFSVPTNSMSPALRSGDRILVNKLVPQAGPLHRGDVVVLRTPGAVPSDRDAYLIKRVIGLPGDKITCCRDDRVVVNGQEIEEPYLVTSEDNSDFTTTVPAGQVWVMSDDRAQKQDSRSVGAVPLDDVTGVVLARIWPLSQVSGSFNDEKPFTAVAGKSWVSTSRRSN